MKPIYLWFELLPEEERTKALRNTKESKMYVLAPSLSSAIDKAFGWAGTPEGGSYWSGLCDKYKETKPSPKVINRIHIQDYYPRFSKNE